MSSLDKQIAFAITITYASLYGFIFIITSIVCAYKINKIRKNKKKLQSNAQSTDQTTPNPSNNDENEQKTTEYETKELMSYDDTTEDNITIDVDTTDDKTQINPITKEKWYEPIKEWFKLVSEKKKVYLALVPHLFDQATDFGVIYQYYSFWKDEDSEVDIGAANPKNFFFASVFVIIFHRIVSTIGIYSLTRKWQDIILQSMDLMMVKAIWVNYKLDKKEKANPQRFLEILEASFESGPQLLISSAYILKTSRSDSQKITLLIIISLLLSLWSITSRVTADDKVMFVRTKVTQFAELGFKYNKFPCLNWQYIFRVILWRFFEITNRVFICILIWVNLGGLALSIIIGFEFVWCLSSAVVSKAVDPLSGLMYVSQSFAGGSYISQILLLGFWFYRSLSNFIYLILITIFSVLQFESNTVEKYEVRNGITIESGIGLFMLIYTWITSCVWPCAGVYVFVKTNEDRDGGSQTVRSYRGLIQSYLFDDIAELIEFGFRPITAKDVIFKNEDSKSSTHYISQSIKNIGVSVNTLIVLQSVISVAPETMISYPLQLECKNGGGLIHLSVKLTEMNNYKKDGKFANKSSEILQEIMDNQNIDIDSVNNDGQTPLHCIAEKETLCDIDINNVKILLENGIDKSIKDKKNETALDIVQKNMDKSVDSNDRSQELAELLCV
eukprot:241038_1